MTTTLNKHQWWRRVGQVLVIVCMLGLGFTISTLALLTTPENFADHSLDEVSDLGALRFLIATLLLLLIPFYRKIPLVLVVAGGFYAVILQGDPYLLAVGLTVWIVRASKPWHWVVAGLGLLCMVFNTLLHIMAVRRLPAHVAPEMPMVLVLTVSFLMFGLVFGISLTTRQRRKIRHASAVAQAARHDRDTISTEMTRQTEREHLAREVHDTLAQRLTALSLQTGQIQKTLGNQDDQELTSALKATKQYSDQALKDLRNLVTTLRDHGERETTAPSVAPIGFEDLKMLLDDAQHQGLRITPCIMVNGYDTAPDELQRATLRIAQEALTNAMRHSTDQTVEIRIEGQPGDGLRLEFINRRDPASHFDGGSQTGLLGITERARLLGGNAEITGEHDTFRLHVDLPWEKLQSGDNSSVS